MKSTAGPVADFNVQKKKRNKSLTGNRGHSLIPRFLCWSEKFINSLLAFISWLNLCCTFPMPEHKPGSKP